MAAAAPGSEERKTIFVRGFVGDCVGDSVGDSVSDFVGAGNRFCCKIHRVVLLWFGFYESERRKRLHLNDFGDADYSDQYSTWALT